MGRAYEVHDTEIKEGAALKFLNPEIASDEKTIERFRNEIKLARKIVHKNTGRMFDWGKSEGTYVNHTPEINYFISSLIGTRVLFT